MAEKIIEEAKEKKEISTSWPLPQAAAPFWKLCCETKPNIL